MKLTFEDVDFYCLRTGIIIILFIILYVLYKSYISPVLYIKELTDVGYDFVPKGPHRAKGILRAQRARKLGSKLPPPYPNGWFAVAESQDLPKGTVLPVDILGQNLCVFRGSDGRARCVDAYCPHLGANLGIGGKVEGNCIQCPFHHWKFDGSGACVSVPGLETAPAGVAVKAWATVEEDGAIWLWHDVEGREPLWAIPPSLETRVWGYRGRNEFIVGSHIQEIPENGADVGHLNAVHSKSLLTGLAEKHPALLGFIGRHVWYGEWSKNEDHTANILLTHNYKFGKISLFHLVVKATQLGPGHVRLMVHSPFGPLLISQSVTPLAALQQKVVHRIFSPWYNAPVAAGFVRGESFMFERDVAVWNSKRFVGSPAYIRADKTIRGFREWYSQFYSENSVSFREALQDQLDW